MAASFTSASSTGSTVPAHPGTAGGPRPTAPRSTPGQRTTSQSACASAQACTTTRTGASSAQAAGPHAACASVHVTAAFCWAVPPGQASAGSRYSAHATHAHVHVCGSGTLHVRPAGHVPTCMHAPLGVHPCAWWRAAAQDCTRQQSPHSLVVALCRDDRAVHSGANDQHRHAARGAAGGAHGGQG